MKSKPSVLDRVKVNESCREDWDAMQGNDQVRFCSHCAKDVHNLSAMTRAEAETLIRKSNGRLCVRFVRRADASIATRTMPSKRLNDSPAARASRLAAGAFTAVLAVTSPSAAQTSPAPHQPITAEAIYNHTDKPQIGSGSATISGQVIDPNDAVIPSASVTLIDATGAIRQTLSSDEGVYRIENLPSGTFTLNVEAIGFANLEVKDVVLTSSEEKRVDANLSIGNVEVTVGLMIVVSPAQPFVYHTSERSQTNHAESPLDETMSEAFNKVMSDDLEELEELLNSGFDVNTRWNGTTPLMVVYDTKIARRLIKAGADINAHDDYGETALMKVRNQNVIKILLNAGAKVNARDNFGVTPLMCAMLAADDEKPARVLIDAGADVNARDKDSRTALMFAAMEGRAETIKVLLDARAEINARDVEGKTPLKLAIENNQEEAIKLLRAAGAIE